jgi:hypothetical protein
MFSEIVNATHATPKAAEFFHSFFTAKSRHDVDATMNHFSKTTLTYIDATLGWPFYTYDALRDVFVQHMPKWPPSGLSYPTLIWEMSTAPWWPSRIRRNCLAARFASSPRST